MADKWVMNINTNTHPRENEMLTTETIQERRALAVARWREAMKNLNRGGHQTAKFISQQCATVELTQAQIAHFNELLAA